jgi:regulator of sigma E protease
MLMTLLAFVFVIVVLVTIHEWGHFIVARLCGVKVLCFSIGFGPAIASYTSKETGTIFKLSCIPLGGYVKMLDEGAGVVGEAELHQAFNRQPLYKRALIVFAGPACNLIFAALLFATLNWSGVLQASPIISSPPANSLLARAGIGSGDIVSAAGFSSEEQQPIVSFDEVRWWLTRAALEKKNVWLTVRSPEAETSRIINLPLSRFDTLRPETDLLHQIGLSDPFTPPMVAAVVPDSAAERAGLKAGDFVRAINGQNINDAMQLRFVIADYAGTIGSNADQASESTLQTWLVLRGQQLLTLHIRPQLRTEDVHVTAKVGIYTGDSPKTVWVHYGPWVGLVKACTQTLNLSFLTVRSIGQMFVGLVSIKNISGPLTIAEYAGKSAALGWRSFVMFLAFLSVSLGVINLFPLPALDGGHLFYYLWEAVVRRPLSALWMERWQRVGISLLIMLMALALFNDVTRLWS